MPRKYPSLGRAPVKRLAEAIVKIERDHPLPRCRHGKPLMDGGGEKLEPTCGCRYDKGDARPFMQKLIAKTPGAAVTFEFIPRLNAVGLAAKLSGDLNSYLLIFAAVEIIERSVRGFRGTPGGDAILADADRIAKEVLVTTDTDSSLAKETP